MPVHGYEIGIGTDLADGSLTNVESIVVSGANVSLDDFMNGLDASTHYLVSGEPLQENIVQLPNITIQQGRSRKEWRFLLVSDVALKHWIDTYRGQRVTIKTTVHLVGTIEKWNAQVGKEIIGESHYKSGELFHQDVIVPMYLVGLAA